MINKKEASDLMDKPCCQRTEEERKQLVDFFENHFKDIPWESSLNPNMDSKSPKLYFDE